MSTRHISHRHPPPGCALDWVCSAVGYGCRIVQVEPFAAATSSAVHAVHVDTARGRRHELVLRRHVKDDWLRREPDLAEREAEALRAVHRLPFGTPRVVAVDAGGVECDAPAVLMSRVRGRPLRRPRDLDEFVRRLAEPLPAIHAVTPPAGHRVRPYRVHPFDVAAGPPAWAGRAEVWARAFEVFVSAPPAAPPVLIHRDYHGDNVLWSGDAVSGVVDWVLASMGSPHADVGHCRFNLVRQFGHATAEHFLQRYAERAGSRPADHHPAWDVLAVVGSLPDFTPADHMEAARLEDFVARAIAALGLAGAPSWRP